jgi:membrane-bound serine protease (ClpP class)
VRRGLKEAEAAGAQFVILDMDTPGGSLGVTLEIIEILQEKFKGRSATFVNDEAISAGAIISSATDQIFFSPRGIIGAAAPVQSGGEEIDETMKQKILSYMRAKIEATTEGHKYRSEVLIAMMDANYELKIDDTVLKTKGELLSLTATKAMKTYGEPPTALLGAGIVDDLPALYQQLAGGAAFEVREFHSTWSLGLAQWLTRISPILLGLGGLCLLIEFKTQTFTGLGIVGVVLFIIVFFGHNVAGLSDHTPMLVFLVGVTLIFVEMFLMPGTFIFAGLGALLMLGSLLWGMADIWPSDGFDVSPSIFLKPAYTVSLGFLLSMALFAAALKFLPSTSLWGRFELAAEIRGSSSEALMQERAAIAAGVEGVVVTPLRPTGTVEVAGRRFEARTEIGELDAGTRIRVVRRADFVLIVERIPS